MLAFDLTSLTAIMPMLIAVVLAAAALFGALASLAHAKNYAGVADDLDVAQEALSVAGQVGQAIQAGATPTAAIASVSASPEAKDLLTRFKVFAHLTATATAAKVAVLFFVLSFWLVACVSPVTPERVSHLRQAVADERQAVTVTAGQEAAVASDRAVVDADLDLAPVPASKVPEIQAKLADERGRVTPRPGFESSVATVRGSIDRDLVTIGSAGQ